MARVRDAVLALVRTSGGRGTAVTQIEPWLREILVCPNCHSALADGESNRPELRCTSSDCGLIYRVDDGIPVLLIDEARAPGS